MTFELLARIVSNNHIPTDAKLMIDSNWEYDAAEIVAVYYNSETNIVLLVHRFNEKYIEYDTDNNWRSLYHVWEE